MQTQTNKQARSHTRTKIHAQTHTPMHTHIKNKWKQIWPTLSLLKVSEVPWLVYTFKLQMLHVYYVVIGY